MSKEELEDWDNDYKNQKLSGGAFILYLKLYIDELESRTCENCKHFALNTKRGVKTSGFCSNNDCSFCSCYVKISDGCNKFEKKEEK